MMTPLLTPDTLRCQRCKTTLANSRTSQHKARPRRTSPRESKVVAQVCPLNFPRKAPQGYSRVSLCSRLLNPRLCSVLTYCLKKLLAANTAVTTRQIHVKRTLQALIQGKSQLRMSLSIQLSVPAQKRSLVPLFLIRLLQPYLSKASLETRQSQRTNPPKRRKNLCASLALRRLSSCGKVAVPKPVMASYPPSTRLR